jgi:hypothetical protein
VTFLKSNRESKKEKRKGGTGKMGGPMEQDERIV